MEEYFEPMWEFTHRPNLGTPLSKTANAVHGMVW